MKYPLLTALALALVSCAKPIPRAIMPPVDVIERLDVKPVAEASKATREAVRDIATAGADTRSASAKLTTTSQQLRDAIDRAEKFAVANVELQNAFAEIQRFSLALSGDVADLTTSLKLAHAKESIAIETIDMLEFETNFLTAKSAAQSAQIEHADKAQAILREQVEALSASSDRLAIAENKLGWWRKAALITWSILTAYIIARFFGAAIRTYARTRI